jgi:hypothetical protein
VSACGGSGVAYYEDMWRRIMKALIVALALATLIAIPTFAPSASAAPMSPASSSFGSNGY